MTMTFSTAVAAFCVFNCFFFASILLSVRTANPFANRFGAALLTALGVALCYDTLITLDVSLKYPSFLVFSTFCLMVGPLSRFSIQSMLKNFTPCLKKDILHFVPFFVVWFLGISSLLFFPDYRLSETHIKGLWAFYQTHACIYFVLNFSLIKQYRNQMNPVLSDSIRYNLNWLTTLAWCKIAVWFTWIGTEYGGNYFDVRTRLPIYALFICFIFYNIVRYKAIFPFLYPNNKQAVSDFLTTDDTAETASKSKETDPRLLEFTQELLDFMVDQKPYLDPELSLPKLAEQMSVSVHFLSQAINTGLNENFYQFVNGYRVEESKKLLHDPNKQHFNILQIAFEAGFNSKTTFNTTFKKMTGISPSEFQKQGKCLGQT
jgi:AraC-like DNA-binding protein